MRPTIASPWHPGERAVQRRAGEIAQADATIPGIHSTIPPAAAEFVARQPMAVVAALDGSGHMWASLLTGPPGFLRVLRADEFVIAAAVGDGDPLEGALAAGARVGVLIVEPRTRRRARINGPSHRGADGELVIEVDQAYANCPKYIAQREIVGRVEQPTGTTVHRSAGLTPSQQEHVRQADTFFIATADATGNADASHRGGNPGFVEVVAPDRLRFPDYRGNSMYMTLGNLEARPEAGLLFVDWTTGRTLQLTGGARVDWDAGTNETGTSRAVDVTITAVVETLGASPLAWGEPTPSRYNPAVQRSR